jgi:hypothetical protein
MYIHIHTLIYVYVYKLIDIGAAYGTAKSGVGIASMGVMNPGTYIYIYMYRCMYMYIYMHI